MLDVVVLVSIVLAQSDVTNPQADSEGDKVQFQRWQKYYRSVAAQYEMELGTESPKKLTLQPDPVFTYANPAGGQSSHGAMFVWVREGRPEIFGAIWSVQRGDQRSTVHSLHSLSLDPLQAIRNDKTFWAPAGPGIEPFLIPGAPEPAATPPLRLAQMRTLARDFSASTIRDTKERQLQIRPQPAYRWDMSTAERDGAVFVWFEDWDPELLMAIEVRKTEQGPRWHASFARFTNLPVAARHKEIVVWSFEESDKEAAHGGFDKRYNSVHGVDRFPAVREN